MASRWTAMYRTPEWRALRARHLRSHPWCVYCLQQGHQVRGTVVDHRIPHRGDRTLFLDAKNLQTCCKDHHDAVKQKLEKSGVLRGADASGMPVDPNHHWHRR